MATVAASSTPKASSLFLTKEEWLPLTFLAAYFVIWCYGVGLSSPLVSLILAAICVVLTYLLTGITLFAIFNEDVPKPPKPTLKAISITVGSVLGTGLSLWYFGVAVVSLLCEHIALVSGAAIVVASILFYWFVFSDEFAWIQFLQGIIFVTKVSFRTHLNTFAWMYSKRAMSHLKDQAFSRTDKVNYEEQAVDNRSLYGPLVATQPPAPSDGSSSTTSTTPAFFPPPSTFLQAFYNPSLNIDLTDCPVSSTYIEWREQWEHTKEKRKRRRRKASKEKEGGTNDDGRDEDDVYLVNPTLRYNLDAHDFANLGLVPKHIDPFHVTAHDVIGPIMSVKSAKTGFWFTYCLTPVDDENCLPEGTFYSPLKDYFRERRKLAWQKDKARKKQAAARAEAGGNVEKKNGDKVEEVVQVEEEEEEEAHFEHVDKQMEKKYEEGELQPPSKPGASSFRFVDARRIKMLQPCQKLTYAELTSDPMGFTEDQIEKLLLAEILIPCTPTQDNTSIHGNLFLESEQKWWKEHVRTAREQIRVDGYTVLKNIMPPLQLEAFRSYCRRRQALTDTTTSSNCYIFKWKDALATMYNCMFTETMKEITGEDLEPVQSLILYYGEGSFLDVHYDWHPFAYSFSFNVDCTEISGGEGGEVPSAKPKTTKKKKKKSPRSASANGDKEDTTEKQQKVKRKKKKQPKANSKRKGDFVAFPLTMMTKRRSPPLIDLCLELGEGVLFRGQELPHYRHKLPKGHSVISISFSWDRKVRV